ncbi:MAG TPA: hypothetical protein VF374_03290 [Thermoplasmata archaeon]|jgi:hypothetical protein
MDALATVLIVMVALVLLALIAFAFIRSRATVPVMPIAHTHSPNVPGYTHDPRHMEYYRPQIGHIEVPPQSPAEAATTRDPRKEPLPRCPGCGTAIGFDDERCQKCGLTLKDRP